jgi:NitT/TauT family transport system permease protein
MIAEYENRSDATGMFAGMTVLAFGVLVVGSVVDRVERRLMRWKPERSALGINELG